VDQLADLRAVHAALLQAIDDALHQLCRRGEALGLREPAGGFVESHQVGESPTDIDCNQQQVRSSGVPKRYHGAMNDTKRRCPWSLGSEQYLLYHDEEWGVPVHNDRRLFEFLILEGAQAGLSWSTILNKRDNYRRAFARFDPAKVARFRARDVRRLMADAGIVRNRLKIESAIGNARAFLEVRREFGSFDAYLWGFVNGRPQQNFRRSMKQVPARTPLSDAISKDLKLRGFRFVGSTIVYAYMQAVGMVNDHLTACFRRAQLAALPRGGSSAKLRRE